MLTSLSRLRDTEHITAVLREICAEGHYKRIAEPLAPPPDFVRPSDISCRCDHCTQLAAFLAHPDHKVWVSRSAEANRRHACDVDTETDRSGRPYALVCTKNNMNYKRRVAQRKKDLHDSARLRNPPSPGTSAAVA